MYDSLQQAHQETYQNSDSTTTTQRVVVKIGLEKNSGLRGI